jgi:hypothetical protein
LISWGDFFRFGGASGFAPSTVKEMSLWEWLFACDGWKKANGSGEGDGASAPSEDEFFAALENLPT